MEIELDKYLERLVAIERFLRVALDVNKDPLAVGYDHYNAYSQTVSTICDVLFEQREQREAECYW